MSPPKQPHQDEDPPDETAEMLDPSDAAEEIIDDGDAAMDSGEENHEEDDREEIQLQNDSAAYFEHPDSVFCIAQHPVHTHIVATGGSEGEEFGGIGYIFDSTPEPPPVLPASYQSAPAETQEQKSLPSLYRIEGHTDSINALAFTLPSGDFLLSGGLDGRLRVHAKTSASAQSWAFLADSQEVPEINWLAPCPHPGRPNTVALGASDGSVWIYQVDKMSQTPLQIIQSYFLHIASCTAGAWSPSGSLLATVAEDSSLYVWDVFGDASAQGQANGQTVVALTADDQRFAVEGGLYSVAIAPTGAFVAVGGAGGAIKIVGLPRLAGETEASGSAPAGRGGADASAKAKGGKQEAAKGNQAASAGQAGHILADLQAQSEGVESLAFAAPPLTLLAAGSLDGSIVLFDTAHRFTVRRHIKEAHEEYSVVDLKFVGAGKAGDEGWLLTTCGLDGVVRRWDARGGTGMSESSCVAEWRGHRGDGERGGVLGFVQDGERIVTAGDDGVALVFDLGRG